jgi:hypothetical protein
MPIGIIFDIENISRKFPKLKISGINIFLGICVAEHPGESGR